MSSGKDLHLRVVAGAMQRLTVIEMESVAGAMQRLTVLEMKFGMIGRTVQPETFRQPTLLWENSAAAARRSNLYAF